MGEYKRRVNATSRFVGNPKALRAWEWLSPIGERFSDVCYDCGLRTTIEEREELNALSDAFPWPPEGGV
jgi:hypothetical protein